MGLIELFNAAKDPTLENWPKIARIMRKKMKQKGITPYQLSKMMGVPMRSMYRYLDKKDPKPPNFTLGHQLVHAINQL